MQKTWVFLVGPLAGPSADILNSLHEEKSSSIVPSYELFSSKPAVARNLGSWTEDTNLII